MSELIIELHAGESCSIMTLDGDYITDPETWSDLMDCCASRDVEDACKSFNDEHSIDWRIVKRCEDGEYHNVTATTYDKQKLCEHIYFESESDFSDESLAELYLIWQVAVDEQDRQYNQPTNTPCKSCGNKKTPLHTNGICGNCH